MLPSGNPWIQAGTWADVHDSDDAELFVLCVGEPFPCDNKCDVNADCINNKCECNVGYSGNGLTCAATTTSTTMSGTTTCQSGTSVGIDKNGNPDPSITGNCYLTVEAARVTSCNRNNDETDVAEMLIEIQKVNKLYYFIRLD